VKMGHPGTLFVRNGRSFAEKVECLRAAGATIASSPWDVAACAQSVMGR